MKFIIIFLFDFSKAFMQIGIGLINTLPIVPIILDEISPSTYPRPRIFVLEGELLVDRETYYWLYAVLDFLSVCFTGTVSVSIDGMFIIYIEQCCAVYAIIK